MNKILIAIIACLCIALIVLTGLILNYGDKNAESTGTIAGIVYDTTSSNKEYPPFQGVLVEVSAANKEIVRHATTDYNGHFEITRLPLGTYSITVKSVGYSLLYSVGAQQEVTLYNNAETSQVKIYLYPVSTISGKIYDIDTGEPISCACVSNGGDVICFETTSNKDGTYEVEVPAREWCVWASAYGYIGNCYSSNLGTYSYTSGRYECYTINVGKGMTINNIDIGLEVGASVSGRVFLADGITPAKGATVRISEYLDPGRPGFASESRGFPADTISHSSTNANGEYVIKGIPSGKYVLNVFTWDRLLFSEGRYVVSLTKGHLTQMEDIILVPGGSLSGYVYSIDGITPIAGIYIDIYGLFGIGSQNIKTGDDGSFNLTNIAPGEYKVSADLQNWYDSRPTYYYYGTDSTPERATRVVVKSGQETQNINFILKR